MNGDPTFTELGFRRVRIHAHLHNQAITCLSERHYAMNGDPTLTALGFRRVRIYAHQADSGKRNSLRQNPPPQDEVVNNFLTRQLRKPANQRIATGLA
jgi:hypothetical protein